MLVNPIVLLCSERSGSNLVAKIMDAHSCISAPGTAHLFRVMSRESCKFQRNPSALRKAILDLFYAKVSTWKIDSWEPSRLLKLIENEMHPGSIIASIYNAELKENKKQILLITEYECYKYINFIMSFSVCPRFLYAVRDPRDMAVSWINGPAMRGGVVRSTERWIRDQEGFLQLLSQVKSNIKVAFTRYEDLIERPHDEVKKICKHLELPYEENMLDFYTISQSAQEDASRSSMWSNLSKPIINNNKNKYLKQLNSKQIAYIELKTRSLMQIFKYDLHSDENTLSTLDYNTLEKEMIDMEPHTKQEYGKLPSRERSKFEKWSELNRSFLNRTIELPAVLRGKL